jgi:hypothetical protein
MKSNMPAAFLFGSLALAPLDLALSRVRALGAHRL